MVHVDDLEMKDFMSVKYAKLGFPQDSTIVITGGNANGKSTVCDAVALCFAEYRRGETYADFIRKGKDTALVKLNAHVNGEPIFFDITLSTKKGVTPFQRTIHYNNTKYTNSECTALLDSLDMTYFANVLFSMQGKDNITTMTPTQRAHELYKLFNYDFSEFLEKVQAKLDELKTAMTYQVNQIEFLEKQKFDFQEVDAPPFEKHEFEEKEISLSTKASRKESISKIMLENGRVHTSLAQVNKELISRKSAYDIAEERVTQHCNNKAKLESDIAAASTVLSNATSLKVTLANSLATEKSNHATAEESKLAIEKRIAELRDCIVRYEYDIRDFDRRKALVTEGKCDKCGHDTSDLVNPELEKAHDECVTLHAKAVADLAREKEKLAPAVKKHSDSTREQARIEASIAQNDKAIVDAQKKIAEGTEKLTTFDEKYDSIIKTRDDSQKLLLEKTTEQASLTALLIQYDEQELKELNEAIEQLTADISLYNNTMYKNSLILEANNKMHLAKEDNASKQNDARVKVQALSNSIATYTEVKTLLEKNFPNYLVVKTCAKLETEINTFIQTVFPNMRVKLYQNKKGVEFYYLPDITETPPTGDKTSWLSVHMASGMEKQALALAWRVALARAYNIGILLLDEVDSAASEESSQSVFTSLLENDYFSQLFIISHKTDVKNSIISLAKNPCVYMAKKGVFTRTT